MFKQHPFKNKFHGRQPADVSKETIDDRRKRTGTVVRPLSSVVSFQKSLLVLVLLTMALLLLACASTSPATTAAPTQAPPTQAPTLVIATPTPEPKATPAPTKESAAKEENSDEDSEYPLAYDFKAKDLLTGKTFSLSDYRGKIVLLNFWGSWCPPCRMEMPAFQKVYEEYGDDVVIIGVGINDSPGNLTKFAKSIGVTYPITHDRTSEIARHYRIRSLPTTYRIDQEGRVRGVAVGALDEEHLVNAIKELLNEQ